MLNYFKSNLILKNEVSITSRTRMFGDQPLFRRMNNVQ